jgi:hypothetical protein
MSQNKGDDDERLVRYLVGALDDDEIERYDELSIADGEFAVRLQSVEDDLVDSYVRGELSGDTLDRFRAVYLVTPTGRDKVRFAETLLARHHAAPVPASRGLRRAWMPAWAAAAAAVLVILVGYLFVMRARTVPPPQSAVSRTAPPDELPTRPSTREERPPVQGSPPVQPSAQPPQPTAPSNAAVLAFVLLPSTRGVDEPPLVAVPRGTEKADIRIVLESDDFRRYQLTLKDPASDRIIWRSASLTPSTWRGNRVVTARIATTSLKGQIYVFDLSGFPAAGEAELLSSYPFRLVLR